MIIDPQINEQSLSLWSWLLPIGLEARRTVRLLGRHILHRLRGRLAGMTDIAVTDHGPDYWYLADYLQAITAHEARALRRGKSGRKGYEPWSRKVSDPEELLKASVLSAQLRLRDALDSVDRILAKYGVDG